MSGHVLKKLLNDEGEFTKREIVNGKKKLFIGPRNKSSIVVSSSLRSGQQKTITKLWGFKPQQNIEFQALDSPAGG